MPPKAALDTVAPGQNVERTSVAYSPMLSPTIKILADSEGRRMERERSEMRSFMGLFGGLKGYKHEQATLGIPRAVFGQGRGRRPSEAKDGDAGGQG